MWTTETVDSAVWSAATRWMAMPTMLRAFLSASSRARVSDSRMICAASRLTSSSMRLHELVARLVGGHAGELTRGGRAPPRSCPRGPSRAWRSGPAGSRAGARACRATRRGGRRTPRAAPSRVSSAVISLRRSLASASASCFIWKIWSLASSRASFLSVSACFSASRTSTLRLFGSASGAVLHEEAVDGIAEGSADDQMPRRSRRQRLRPCAPSFRLSCVHVVRWTRRRTEESPRNRDTGRPPVRHRDRIQLLRYPDTQNTALAGRSASSLFSYCTQTALRPLPCDPRG